MGLAGGGRVKVNVGAVPVLGEVFQSAVKVFGRELEDAEPEGRGIAAEPLECLFLAALKAGKMMAAAQRCSGGRWVVVRGLGGATSSVTGGGAQGVEVDDGLGPSGNASGRGRLPAG